MKEVKPAKPNKTKSIDKPADVQDNVHIIGFKVEGSEEMLTNLEGADSKLRAKITIRDDSSVVIDPQLARKLSIQ